MIALLPVSRYLVEYQVAKGRPYSFFERFILEAVHDGQASLEALEKTFRVHRRALIEGVVTLIQAGWVVIDKDTHRLLPTKAGRLAIDVPNQLPSNIVVADLTDLLQDELVERARAKERQLAQNGVLRSPDSALSKLVRRDLGVVEPPDLANPYEWQLEAASNRFVVGRDHQSLLENWLETAHSYVGVVCGPLDIARVSELEEAIRSAVQRGVLMDVIWSSPTENAPADAHRKAFDLLKKIEWDSHHGSGRGRLTLGSKAVPSNARVLLGDAGDSFEAVVGSCDWFAVDQPSRRDLSLLFRERGPVARVARLVADLAAADQRLSTGVGLTRLRRAAADLDRETAEAVDQASEIKLDLDEKRTQVPESRGAVRTRIVVGRQHGAVLPELAERAQVSLVVACHRWGGDSGGALKSLTKALHRGCEVSVR